MKWFQLDADMPDDPRIRAVTRALGVAGLGALVGIWCHVAKHGREPGRGIDSRGMAFPVDDILAASMLPHDQFHTLIDICTRTGHFDRDAWIERGELVIPAMTSRADRYTRRLMRGRSQDATATPDRPPPSEGTPDVVDRWRAGLAARRASADNRKH